MPLASVPARPENSLPGSAVRTLVPPVAIAFALLCCISPTHLRAQEKNPHEGQDKIDPARVYTFEKQELDVADFPAEGWILDLGGGGEGIIGRLKGSQVVAIDLYSWGLRRT